MQEVTAAGFPILMGQVTVANLIHLSAGRQVPIASLLMYITHRDH